MSDVSAAPSADDQPSATRRRLKWLVRWVVGLALLALVLVLVPLDEAWAALKSASPGALLAGAGLALVVHMVQARRLQILARALGLEWTWWKVLEIHLSSMAYGLVLPGGNLSGTAVRAYKLGRRSRQFTQAAAALLVDRVMATAFLGLTGLVCLIVSPLPEPWAFGLVLAGLTVVGLLALLPAAVGVGSLPGIGRLEPLPVIGKIVVKLAKLPRVPMMVLARAALLATLSHAAGIVVCVYVARSVGLTLEVFSVGVARALMLVAALLPITVAGIGVRESAAVVVLGAMDEATGPALAFSLLFFLVMWVGPAMIGAAMELFERSPHEAAEDAESR